MMDLIEKLRVHHPGRHIWTPHSASAMGRMLRALPPRAP